MPSHTLVDDRNAKTVLVVDDEDTTRGLICLILRQGGYTILEAGDCQTATNIYSSHPGQIDLLLTDFSLPGRNGCQLAASLKEMEPGLRVLFMSGLPGADVYQFSGMPKEGWGFLQKPFGVPELLKSVQRFLD